MKYQGEALRDALAAEYALGTLRGPARRRFESLLKYDPKLQRVASQWETRLAPLNHDVDPVQPPESVWREIKRRIEARSRAPALTTRWDSLGFWRIASFAGAAATIVLAAMLALLVPSDRSQEMMVVVMVDDYARPAMTVSWPTEGHGDKELRVRLLVHAEVSAGSAWELWMLPRDDGKPISLGLLTSHEMQVVNVPARLVGAVNAAWGLAMSAEPMNGSPVGVPTGRILYKGPCTML